MNTPWLTTMKPTIQTEWLALPAGDAVKSGGWLIFMNHDYIIIKDESLFHKN
jgi:hypothetical protein